MGPHSNILIYFQSLSLSIMHKLSFFPLNIITKDFDTNNLYEFEGTNHVETIATTKYEVKKSRIVCTHITSLHHKQ